MNHSVKFMTFLGITYSLCGEPALVVAWEKERKRKGRRRFCAT